MKLALAQIKLTNDITANLLKHKDILLKSTADLVVFPECSISGYDLMYIKETAIKHSTVFSCFRSELDNLCQHLGKKAIVGLPLLDGQILYNASVLLGVQNSEQSTYYKRSLTNDELSVFTAGVSSTVFNVYGKKVGVLICRDQSTPEYFKEYCDKGVDAIIIQSAHYYEPLECIEKRNKNVAIPIIRAIDFGVPIFKVNAVGELSKKISCGNSIGVNSVGSVLSMLGETEEDVLLADL